MHRELLVDVPDPRSVFVEGRTAEIVEQIRAVVTPLVFDVGTTKGRRDCASWAAKVARSKTLLDAIGKDIVSDWKAKSRVVDQQRKLLRDSLDELKAEVRSPLTAIEDEEKRLQKQRARQIENIKRIGNAADEMGRNFDSSDIKTRLALLHDIPTPDEWFGDLHEPAFDAYRFAKQNLESALVLRLEDERKAAESRAREIAELERVREREIVERVEQEKARAAHRESLALAREQQAMADALAKAETEKRAAVEAEKRRAAAEADRKERERVAYDRARDEAENAKRIEAEKLAADEKHRASVHAEILSALSSIGVPDDDAKKVLGAIKDGLIPYVTIEYWERAREIGNGNMAEGLRKALDIKFTRI